jgi:hypothetical protein
MKALYFFAILVFVTLSTNVGFAGHRNHHAHADTGAHASGTAAQGQGKPATDGPQSSAPSRTTSDRINEGTAKDRAGVVPTDQIGKRATDPSGPHVKTPPPDVPANTVPIGAFGQPHPPAGNGTKENNEVGTPIDTRITVHQGRQAPNSNGLKEIREFKEGLFKKAKIAIAPAIDPIRLSIRSHQPTSPLGTDGAPARNAVGAIIKHRAAALQSTPPAPSDAIRQVPSGMPTTGPQISRERAPGMVSTGDVAKPLNGSVPAIGVSPMPSSHPSKTTALAIVTTNGPVVNGTEMIRPGSGSGAVGGPANVIAGAISGSSFRPKHP